LAAVSPVSLREEPPELGTSDHETPAFEDDCHEYVGVVAPPEAVAVKDADPSVLVTSAGLAVIARGTVVIPELLIVRVSAAESAASVTFGPALIADTMRANTAEDRLSMSAAVCL
jgi:hypothetical protein